MSLYDSLETPAPPMSRSRAREWLGMALVIALPLGLLVTAAAFLNHYTNRDWDEALAAADKDLAEAVSEADRLDPAWRLEELIARRKELSDENNSAVRIVAAKKLQAAPPTIHQNILLGRGKEAQTLDEILRELSPEVQLNAEQTARLRAELQENAAAVAEARKLAELPEGRYPITFQPDYVSTLLPSQQEARAVARLLTLDATLLAQDGDPDQALVSVRAALNAGRSVGDEPLIISQLIRLACRSEAIRILERVLAQGEPSDKALVAVQQLLTEEDAYPSLLVAIRGERACLHRLMEALESGEVKQGTIQHHFNHGMYDSAKKEPEQPEVDLPTLKATHAWMLRWMNEYVETAKLLPWECGHRWQELKERLHRDAPPLARLLLPDPQKFPARFQQDQAHLRCALVAVAVERYRAKQGRWPRSLMFLEENQLKTVPLDPYDGQPLRFCAPVNVLVYWIGNFVLYSIGYDSEDNQGRFDGKQPNASGQKLQFRLWNPDQRRRELPPVSEP